MIELTIGVFAVIFSLYGGSNCNVFENVQRGIASEGPYQPYSAQLAIARAIRDHGPCEWDEGYLSGMRVARVQWTLGNYANHHVRSYFNLYSFPHDTRESWAVAAYVALVENPPIHVSHFFSTHDHVEAILCPHGYEQAGEVVWC